MVAYFSIIFLTVGLYSRGIVFLVPLYLMFFFLTVVLTSNNLEYVNVQGPFEFWNKLALLFFDEFQSWKFGLSKVCLRGS